MTDYVYVLRCVNADMTSRNNFKWPTEGYVEALDWDPEPHCGNGLHGFLWGEGNISVARWNDNSKWLVVKVGKADVVDRGGKVKFPKGEVVFCGQRHEAANHIVSLGANGRVHFVNREVGNKVDLVGGDYSYFKAGFGSTISAGNSSNLTAGDESMLKAGNKSTLTAGRHSTLTAGNYSTLTAWAVSNLKAGHSSTLTADNDSTLTADHGSTLTAGDRSTLTAGDYSTLTAGNDSTLTARYHSTLTAGNNSTLTAEKCSTLTAGNDSTLTAEKCSTLTAGLNSVLIGRCVDTNKKVVATVGQNGIQPNVAYTVKDGKFVPA